MARLTGLVAASVAIGFAVKDILQSRLSGLLPLRRRPREGRPAGDAPPAPRRASTGEARDVL